MLFQGIDGVNCVAILNDTVGCLMSCAFTDHNCNIGVILGKLKTTCDIGVLWVCIATFTDHICPPSKHKTLYNICTMLYECRRHWADIVQRLYKCFVFAGLLGIFQLSLKKSTVIKDENFPRIRGNFCESFKSFEKKNTSPIFNLMLIT